MQRTHLQRQRGVDLVPVIKILSAAPSDALHEPAGTVNFGSE
jgi:hypothetical protein